jgi:asparaginyl-tRNA synthetase
MDSPTPARQCARLIQIYGEIFAGTVQFHTERGIRTIYCPLLTGSVSSPAEPGSDSTPVAVRIQDESTYLIDSAQFYLEAGCRFHQAGCFSFLPSFRGDTPDATHLSQFSHSEVEILGSFDDAIALSEDYVRHLCQRLLDKSSGAIQESAGTASHVESLLSRTSFPRIRFPESLKIVGNTGYVEDVEHGFRRLTREGEINLIRHFRGPVWVTEMDHLSVPFYQAFADAEGKIAKAADLLLGLGEVIGLGERHKTPNDTRRALRLHNVSYEPYEWYIDMQTFAPLQTAGFGLGVERFICWALGLSDIRESIFFPVDLSGTNKSCFDFKSLTG